MDYVLQIFVVVTINCGPPTPVIVWDWLTYSRNILFALWTKLLNNIIVLLLFLVDITKKQDGHFDAPPHLFMKVSSVLGHSLQSSLRTFSSCCVKTRPETLFTSWPSTSISAFIIQFHLLDLSRGGRKDISVCCSGSVGVCFCFVVPGSLSSLFLLLFCDSLGKRGRCSWRVV